jgi:hypothetical protein
MISVIPTGANGSITTSSPTDTAQSYTDNWEALHPQLMHITAIFESIGPAVIDIISSNVQGFFLFPVK